MAAARGGAGGQAGGGAGSRSAAGAGARGERTPASGLGGPLVDGNGDRVDDDVPVCLQPGEWRENKGGQVLADFLLHSIDKRENRMRREKEAAHYAACTAESESDSDDAMESDPVSGAATRHGAGGQEEEQDVILSDDQLQELRDELLRLVRTHMHPRPRPRPHPQPHPHPHPYPRITTYMHAYYVNACIQACFRAACVRACCGHACVLRVCVRVCVLARE